MTFLFKYLSMQLPPERLKSPKLLYLLQFTVAQPEMVYIY